ncbi:MAG: Hpt domain-containing protein [Methylococcaceae bacterium]
MFSVLPNPTRLSIHKCLLWVALLPYLMVVLGFAGHLVYEQTARVRQAYEYRAVLMAQRLACTVSNGLEYWNGDRLRAWLGRQPEQLYVSRLSVYDLQGRELALFTINTPSTAEGVENLVVDEPVLSEERVIGRIRLVWSSNSRNEHLAEELESVAMMLVITLGILAWIRRYLIHAHIRPLRLLNERIRRWVAQEHSSDLVPAYGNDFESIRVGLDVLVDSLNRERERYTQERQKWTLEARRFECLLHERNRALDTAHTLSDMERRARLLFLSEVESGLRPLLLDANQPLNLIETFDNLIRDWRQDGLNPEYGSHDFDPRVCLEHLMGVLVASLPNITLILAVSPDVPKKVYGDSSRITQILMHWITQLGRVMHHGRLVIRVRVSVLRGEPGWLIVIHAPLADISTEVRNRLSFLFGAGHVLYTDTQGNRNTTSVASVIQALGGRYGIFSGMGDGVFCSMNLPLGQVNKNEAVLEWQGISVCVIDSVPLSRKAWVWQLMSLGIRAVTCEGIDSATHCIAIKSRLKIVILNQQSSLQRGSRLESFAESCKRVDAWPVLILPYGDLEGRDYYRRKGAICLNQPIRSADWLKLIMDVQKSDAKQANEWIGHPVFTPEKKASDRSAVGLSSRPETRLRPSINHTARQEKNDLAQVLLAATRNNQPLAITLVKKMLEEWPVQVLAVDGALESGRWQEAMDITHQINGAASLCGLTELREAAHALESLLNKAMESGQVPDYPASFRRVQLEINELTVSGRQLLVTFGA